MQNVDAIRKELQRIRFRSAMSIAGDILRYSRNDGDIQYVVIDVWNNASFVPYNGDIWMRLDGNNWTQVGNCGEYRLPSSNDGNITEALEKAFAVLEFLFYMRQECDK